MRKTLVVFLALLCLAPTAGDIGGCGTEVVSLDAVAFAKSRKSVDCRRCSECGIPSLRCQRACDPTKEPETAIPDTCKPVDHDGDVCLRALRAASCDAYATYVADVGPSTPTECEFCKIAPPAPPPAFAADGAP